MGRILPYNAKQWEIPLLMDGRRTVTRRAVKPQPEHNGCLWKLGGCRWSDRISVIHPMPGHSLWNRMPHQPGDILYVRERFCKGRIECGENPDGTDAPYVSQGNADTNFIPYEYCIRNNVGIEDVIWKPSIHMPKEAARIWLKVTDVRVEQLKDMKPEDIRKEGMHLTITPEECDSQFDKIGAIHFYEEARKKFSALWNSTLKKSDLSLYGWDANPWVWVIEFERCEKSEE